MCSGAGSESGQTNFIQSIKMRKLTKIVLKIRLDAFIDDLPLDRIDLLMMDIDGPKWKQYASLGVTSLRKSLASSFHDD
jgi:hypothetical protein